MHLCTFNPSCHGNVSIIHPHVSLRNMLVVFGVPFFQLVVPTKGTMNFTVTVLQTTRNTDVTSLRVPLNLGVLEHGHHTNRNEGRFDDDQRSKSPENLLCVQGHVPLLIAIQVISVHVVGDPAR